MIKCLRAQLEEKNDVIEQKDKMIENRDKLIKELTNTVEAVNRIFNNDQIRKLKNPSANIRWSDKTLQESMHCFVVCSSTAYDYLRDFKGLPLPCSRTLRNHMQKIKFKPGILTDFITLLGLKVKDMPDNEKYCGLYIDEMSIQPKKELNRTHGEMYGAPTIPLSKTQTKKFEGQEILATKALNFMFAGLRSRWKQPVAFHFTGDSFDPEVVTDIIKELIKHSRDIGLKMRCITTDMGPGNLTV